MMPCLLTFCVTVAPTPPSTTYDHQLSPTRLVSTCRHVLPTITTSCHHQYLYRNTHGEVSNLTKYLKDRHSLRFNFQTLLSSLLKYKSKQVLLWKQAELHIFNIPGPTPLPQLMYLTHLCLGWAQTQRSHSSLCTYMCWTRQWLHLRHSG